MDLLLRVSLESEFWRQVRDESQQLERYTKELEKELEQDLAQDGLEEEGAATARPRRGLCPFIRNSGFEFQDPEWLREECPLKATSAPPRRDRRGRFLQKH